MESSESTVTATQDISYQLHTSTMSHLAGVWVGKDCSVLQSHLQTDADDSWTSKWFPELRFLLPVPLGILLVLNLVLFRYL